MPNRVRVLAVGDGDREELERRVRGKSSPARTVERARIVLLSADGLTGREIAERVGCSEQTVVAWRARYAKHGVAGLDDAPRSGRPRRVDDAMRYAILAKTLQEPPRELGITHWSSRLLAEQFGVDHATIARLWADYGVKPHRLGTFKFSPTRGSRRRSAMSSGCTCTRRRARWC